MMHRINTKKRRTLILRCLAYAATVILSILTTALLVYTALGYQFDPRSGQVVHNGLLLINALPSGTEIHIDGQQRTTVPGRFVLSGGQYDISLQHEGYRAWSKSVKIVGSAVETIRYPLLVPDKLQTVDTGVKIGSPGMVSQSPDKKLMAIQQRSGQAPILLEVKDDINKTETLDIADVVSGSLGKLRAVMWSEDSSRVLLEHRPQTSARNNDKEYISIPINNPSESVNISQRYNRDQPQQLMYRSNNEVYGISRTGVLTRYSLQSTQSQDLLADVLSYSFSDDNRLAFVRSSSDGKTHEAGVFDQREADQVTVLHSEPVSQKNRLYTASQAYDNHWYVTVVSSDKKNRVEVYRNPLDPPILTHQLPFVAISFASSQVLPSPNGQFLLLRDGQEVYVYNFDALRSYRFTIPHTLRTAQGTQWITPHHVLTVDDKQQAYIADFDGANQYQLTKVATNTSLYIDSKREAIYGFTGKALQSTSLLIPEDQ